MDHIDKVHISNLDTVRAHEYPNVALDTEFPGVVARPIRNLNQMQTFSISFNLSFLNKDGEMPEGVCSWQFNFKFNLSEDMYAEESVDLLLNSGLKFDRHEREGIEPIHFAEMLIVSGIVLLDNVKWLELLAMLPNSNLPETEEEFFKTLRIYFPNVYDIKYLMKSCKNLKGGLQEVADMLEVERIGPQHQAGSDSLLTGRAYFKMVEIYFEDELDDQKVSLLGGVS